MEMFKRRKVICICCEERCDINKAKWIYKNLGICEICNERLPRISRNSSFEGGGNMSYLISAYYYKDMIQRLVSRFKFSPEIKIGGVLTNMLYDYIKEIEQIKEFDIICTIPLSRKRLRERGFNQAEVMAKQLSEKMGIEYMSCVYRCRHTLAQSTLKREERLENIKDAFLADRKKVTGKRILLVDDIHTTGATMNACAKELIQKGAQEVVGIAFSKGGNF